MKTAFVVTAITAAVLSTAAVAQMGQGMGPGRMGGQGMGPGMGGQADCPMGSGMGPGMQGHGKMHGPGAGRGMMGGHGMGMRGMGGMGGFAGLEALNLTDEQRGKVTEIQRDLQRKTHGLKGSLREIRWQSQDAAKATEFDDAAARKRYDSQAAVRKQMFEARLEAHKRIQDVLTKEQREQLRKSGRPGVPG